MSTARFNTLENAAGTKSVPVSTVVDGSAKAWVNFNGTGTVAIRASFNVTSITDNGVGIYTVNFTTAMADANYATIGTGRLKDTSVYAGQVLIESVGAGGTYSTSAVRVIGTNVYTGGFTYEDLVMINVAVFR